MVNHEDKETYEKKKDKKALSKMSILILWDCVCKYAPMSFTLKVMILSFSIFPPATNL